MTPRSVARLAMAAAVAAVGLDIGWRGRTDVNAQAPSVRDELARAFGLAGHWTITRMDVSLVSLTGNPSSVPGALAAAVNAEIGSGLGAGATFDVDSSGNIKGSGDAHYTFHVAAGSSALSAGAAATPFRVGISLPVGATATLDEAGARAFAFAGRADFTKRVIELGAFQPTGGPLAVLVRPGGARMDVPVWPAMTNVEAPVTVQGASLLARASGVVGGQFQCTFEAVKFVDLAPLFEQLGAQGPPGPRGLQGPAGPPGLGAEQLQSQLNTMDARVKDLEHRLHDATLELGGAKISIAETKDPQTQQIVRRALVIDAPFDINIQSPAAVNLKGGREVTANGINVVR
jgi:hypothetical protein